MDKKAIAVIEAKDDFFAAAGDVGKDSTDEMAGQIKLRGPDDVLAVDTHGIDAPSEQGAGQRLHNRLNFGQLRHLKLSARPNVWLDRMFGAIAIETNRTTGISTRSLAMESKLGLVQPQATDLAAEELAAVERLQKGYHDLKGELGKVIVGQEAVIEELLIALFCRGHALLVGVPGLAKTLLISTLSKTLGLSFNRIQFTPDLMPSDITGTEVIEEDKTTGGRQLRFVRGPVFANVILADEINRTPPKTQAALLEAMQEHQVTAGGKLHRLSQPFFVLATQNPIEQEGTYPLPEAQLDRFMFNINVGYPTEEEEFQIVRLTTMGRKIELEHVLTGEEVLQLQETVRKVPVADHVIRYALQMSRLTRRSEGGCPDFVNEFVAWGAGPRASQYLILAGKARALLKGRYHVSTEDIRQVALPVLRHRIVTNFNAEAEGVKSDALVKKLIEFVPRQQYEELDKTAAKMMKDAPAA
jgi:MoxR-like ATPase